MLADEEQTKQLISLAEFEKESLEQLLSKLRDMEFDWKITNALLYYIGTLEIPHKTSVVLENWTILCMASAYAKDVVYTFLS